MTPTNCLKCEWAHVSRNPGFTQMAVCCRHPRAWGAMATSSYDLGDNVRFAKATATLVRPPKWCPLK